MEISSIIVSITALIVSLIVAIKQIGIATQQNSLPVIVTMFQEWCTKEHREHREYIINKLTTENSAEVGYQNLTPEAKNHVLTVSHFIDNLAVLVSNNIINEKLVISFLGESILTIWNILEPYIETERKVRGRDYQEYFEDLVCRIKKTGPKEYR